MPLPVLSLSWHSPGAAAAPAGPHSVPGLHGEGAAPPHPPQSLCTPVKSLCTSRGEQRHLRQSCPGSEEWGRIPAKGGSYGAVPARLSVCCTGHFFQPREVSLGEKELVPLALQSPCAWMKLGVLAMVS